MSGKLLIVHVSVFPPGQLGWRYGACKKVNDENTRNLAIYLPDTDIMWDLLFFSDDYIYSFRY